MVLSFCLFPIINTKHTRILKIFSLTSKKKIYEGINEDLTEF